MKEWLVIIAGFETKRPLEQALAQKRREIHDIQGGCKIGLADVGWHYNSGGGGCVILETLRERDTG